MIKFIGHVERFILLNQHQKYTRASILKITSLEIYLCNDELIHAPYIRGICYIAHVQTHTRLHVQSRYR